MVRKLEELGFAWQLCIVLGWDAMFEELKEFRAKHGHCNVPQKTGIL